VLIYPKPSIQIFSPVRYGHLHQRDQARLADLIVMFNTGTFVSAATFVFSDKTLWISVLVSDPKFDAIQKLVGSQHLTNPCRLKVMEFPASDEDLTPTLIESLLSIEVTGKRLYLNLGDPNVVVGEVASNPNFDW